MAHKLKVEIVPHTNKDGSPSKTKKDYILTDRTRGKKLQVGVASSQKALDQLMVDYRSAQAEMHLSKHPNDRAFRQKHGVK